MLGLLILAALGVLLTKLWNLQITNSGQAVERAETQTTVKSRIAPARGGICDRNGVDLADNRPSFDIDFYLDVLERDYAKRNKNRVPHLTVPSHQQVDADGNVVRDKWGNPVMTKPYSEVDIAEIVKESIQPVSQTLGLSAPLNERDIRKHFREEADLPYHYMTDLDFATVAQFEERNFGIAGIEIAQNPAREYPLGAFASHILGYVGRPVNQEEHVADDGTPFETVGLHGIEEIMDDHLQGEPGSRIRRVSSQGYYEGELARNDPTMGNTVYLTIDARVQYIAETAFRDSGWTRGAVIVMDPKNGDVLALASFPNYDPNTFIPRIKSADWDKLNNDPTTPLFNRALHTFQPGSTLQDHGGAGRLEVGPCHGEHGVRLPLGPSRSATTFSTIPTARRAARWRWSMPSRSRATCFFTSTASRRASTRSMPWARAPASATSGVCSAMRMRMRAFSPGPRG